MESLCGQPSLELGVRVVRVAGLDPADHQLEGAGGGTLFVRYHVPAGDGRRRLRVDTREVPCAGGHDGPFWGDHARFECWGPPGVAGAAATGSIAFELRWRPRLSSPSGLAAALLGAGARRRLRPSSRVLARAELAAWPEGAAERWLPLSPAGRELGGGSKAPRLLVEVSAVRGVVAAAGGGAKGKGVKKTGGGTNECCGAGERCGQCGWVGSEEDMFLAATFAQ